VARTVDFATPTLPTDGVVNLDSGSSSAGPALDSYPESARLGMDLPQQRRSSPVTCGLGGKIAQLPLYQMLS
jgi:hypothetical protein